MSTKRLVRNSGAFAKLKEQELNGLIQERKGDDARWRDSDDYAIGFARAGEGSHYTIARTPFKSTFLHSSATEPKPILSGGRKKGKSKKKGQVGRNSAATSTLPASSYVLPIFGEGNVSERIDAADTSIDDLLAMGDTLLTESASLRASVPAAEDASTAAHIKLGPAWAADPSTPLLEEFFQKSNKFFVSMEYADRLKKLLGNYSQPDSLPDGLQGNAREKFSDARNELDLGPEMSPSLSDLESAVMGKALAYIDLKEAQWHLTATKIQSQLDFKNDGGAKQRFDLKGNPITHPGGGPWMDAKMQTPKDREHTLKTVINNMNTSRDRLEAAQKAIDAEHTSDDGVPTVYEILEKYRTSLMPVSAEDWAIQNEAIQDNSDEAEDAEETIASAQPDQFLIGLREDWKPKSEVHLALSWDKQRQTMKAQFMLGCTAVGSEDIAYPSLPHGSGLVNPNLKPETKHCDDSVTHDDEDPCRITPDDFKPLWTDRSAAQAFAEGVAKLVEGCSTAQDKVSGPYNEIVQRIVKSEIVSRESVLKSLARTAKANQAWIDLVAHGGRQQVLGTWMQTRQDWLAGDGEIEDSIDDFARDKSVSELDQVRLRRWHDLARRATDPSQYYEYILSALDTGYERVYGRFREENAKTPLEIQEELEESQRELQQDMKNFTKDMQDHGINQIPKTVEDFIAALRSRASQIKVEEETARAEEARRAQEESAAELALSEKRKALHQEWLAMETALKERFSQRTYVPSVGNRDKQPNADSSRDTAGSLPGDRRNKRDTRVTPLDRWKAKEAERARLKGSSSKARSGAPTADSLTPTIFTPRTGQPRGNGPRTYSEACVGAASLAPMPRAMDLPQQPSSFMADSHSTSAKTEQTMMHPPNTKQERPETPGETTDEVSHGSDTTSSHAQDSRQEPVPGDCGPEDPQTRPDYIPLGLPSIDAPRSTSMSLSPHDESVPKAAVRLPVAPSTFKQSSIHSAASTKVIEDAKSSKPSKSRRLTPATGRPSADSSRSKRFNIMSQHDVAAQLEHRTLIGGQLQALRYQEGLRQGAGVASQLVQSQAQQYIQGLARGWSTSIQALGLETHRQFASQQSMVQSLAYQIQCNRQHIDYLDGCLRTAVETNQQYVPVEYQTTASYGRSHPTTVSGPMMENWKNPEPSHNDSGYYDSVSDNAHLSATGTVFYDAPIYDSPQQLSVQPDTNSQGRQEEYVDFERSDDRGIEDKGDEAINDEAKYGLDQPELRSDGIDHYHLKPEAAYLERQEGFIDFDRSGDNDILDTGAEAIDGEEYGTNRSELGLDHIYDVSEDLQISKDDVAYLAINSATSWVREDLHRGLARRGSL